MANMRGRLVVGLLSLGATLILTVPTMGAARQPQGRILGSALLSIQAVGEVIWPNGAFVDDAIIWPNPATVSDTFGGP
jgi:hypothetical protein